MEYDKVFEAVAVKEIHRDAQVYHIPINSGKVGAGAGYASNNDKGIVTLPASTGASTWTVGIPLHQGDVITAFRITGQLEGAGVNANVLDADLRVMTAVAAGSTDASLGAITQVSQVSDYKINESKTLAAAHTVISGNNYYVLITGTTLANGDQELLAIEVTVNKR